MRFKVKDEPTEARVVAIIKRFDPKAFYSIEDVKFASEAIFPLIKPGNTRNIYELLKIRRKGK